MRPTITDIAKKAGVSKATVSRVLNKRSDGVGAETRRRVERLITQMDFEPCGAARSLATGKSRSIGLVIPDIADPFCPLLIRGIEDALRSRSYGLFLCDSDQDIHKEKENLRILLEKRVDGVILSSTMSDCDSQLRLLEKREVPFVLLDRIIEARPGVAGVYADNRKGARMAAEHLLAGGARRLLFINGPEMLSVSKLRRVGFEGGCAAAGLEPSSILHASGDYSVESGELAAGTVLDAGGGRAPFDAVFAACDRMAIGALRALKRRGFDVPRDIEVVGFDDVEPAGLVDPPLTTIAQPAFEMGRSGASLLLRLIDGERPRSRIKILEPTLVVRGTTRPR